MKEKNAYVSFLMQTFIAFPVLFFLFIYFDPVNELDREADGVNMIIFGMILPTIFSLFTIFICLVVGIPLRIFPAINNWWLSKPLLQILGLLSGIVILFLSVNKNFTKTVSYQLNESMLVKEYSNEYISLTGWFLTAFFLLHLYWGTIINYCINKLTPKNNWMKNV